jgi:hypothetical protein
MCRSHDAPSLGRAAGEFSAPRREKIVITTPPSRANLFRFFNGKACSKLPAHPLKPPVSAYFLGSKRLLPNSALITLRMRGYIAHMAKANDVRPIRAVRPPCDEQPVET